MGLIKSVTNIVSLLSKNKETHKKILDSGAVETGVVKYFCNHLDAYKL